MSMFERCPQQYAYRYIEGFVEPPALALALGTTFGDVIDVQHLHKIETGENLSSSDIQDAFHDRWKKGHKVFGRDGKNQFMPWKDIDTSEKLKNGKRIALASVMTYHEGHAVQIDPVDVERKYYLDFYGGHFVGYSDVVHKLSRGQGIIDMKLVGRRYDNHAANSSMQLASYGWAEKQVNGKMPVRVSFHCTVKKNSPEVQVLDSKLNQGRLDGFLYWAETQLMGIHSERFPGRIGVHCNWCGYQHRCPWYKGKEFVSVKPTELTIEGKRNVKGRVQSRRKSRG